ncbi:hypothetical protein AIT23_05365 [Salmonella bongori serovar 40:z35:-]|uniref:hypothetical protein n=1 Tax=Salmonella bongori TaxID=54736 RepID=UPI00198F9E29|nr:hypothetical protein [Salmonella bongori]QVP38422.1 hypothetical protein AIT23_05365 [Salmonella bongori serovar 40:z35:-]
MIHKLPGIKQEEAHPDGWAFLRLCSADQVSVASSGSLSAPFRRCRMATFPYPAYETDAIVSR